MSQSSGIIANNPVLLNNWKHHFGFIIENILHIKNEADFNAIKANLQKIGESQMDLYLGDLTPQNIIDQIYSFIQLNNLSSKQKYQSWLITDLKKGYSQLTLSDTSIWTLRLGNEDEKFVHIHPSRYSPFTIRIKATVLKTGILLFGFLNFNKGYYIDINLVNQLRKDYLNESPLKTIDIMRGLGKFLEFFNKELEKRQSQ